MQAASYVRTSDPNQGTSKSPSSLGLTRLDSTYANNLRTNGEKLLLPPEQVPAGVELWSCRGDDFLQWLTDRNKSDARIEYIDVREPKGAIQVPSLHVVYSSLTHYRDTSNAPPLAATVSRSKAHSDRQPKQRSLQIQGLERFQPTSL